MTILAAVEPPRPSLDPELMRHTAEVIREIALEWQRETPVQLHNDTLEGNGYQYHPDFIAYIERTCRMKGCTDPGCTHGLKVIHPDRRVRVSRAFRLLREDAPREFDALYMVCRHGYTLAEISERLNRRSINLGHADRYSLDGVRVLVMSGAHKIEQWW